MLWKLIPLLINGLPMCPPILYVAFSLIDGFFCCAETLDFDVVTYLFLSLSPVLFKDPSYPMDLENHKMWGGDHLELASPGWEKQ